MESKNSVKPRILIFSSLFPSSVQPLAGIFIKERMFRVGKRYSIVVVAPVPWFPLQSIIRIFRPHYRPKIPRFEIQDSVEVYRPRFLSIPGMFRTLDGFFMAIFSYTITKQLKRKQSFNIIDSHFAYPDGYAASLLGKWLNMPVSITLRGTEIPQSKTNRREKILKALANATRIFSVANYLKQFVVKLGAKEDKILVVGNGVDTDIFKAIDRDVARVKLGIPSDAQVLISIGGLVERKGFHRVIECLPGLKKKYTNLMFLIIGGASGEGNWEHRIQALVKELGLSKNVRILGAMPPDKLLVPLSCADLFVLATRNEGWANVFLEAMACGLPIVTTQVGGNPEVVKSDRLGILVPFGDKVALESAIDDAMEKEWNRDDIVAYAVDNSWDKRIDLLEAEFQTMLDRHNKATLKSTS